MYAKGLYEKEKDLSKAEQYLKDSIEFYKTKRLADDSENCDSPAYYRIAKILDLNVVSTNEKAIDYYKKAVSCVPMWFYSRRYIEKAENKLKEHHSSVESTIKPVKQSNNKHIMISYAKETREITKLIQEALEKCGFTVWIDYKSMKENIFSDMAIGVENASHIVACISEYYENSHYCQKELAYAISNVKKPVIPVIVQESYTPKGWLGISIAGLKYYRITNQISLETNFPSILKSIDDEKYNEVIQSQVCNIS